LALSVIYCHVPVLTAFIAALVPTVLCLLALCRICLGDLLSRTSAAVGTCTRCHTDHGRTWLSRRYSPALSRNASESAGARQSHARVTPAPRQSHASATPAPRQSHASALALLRKCDERRACACDKGPGRATRVRFTRQRVEVGAGCVATRARARILRDGHLKCRPA
jgi:hypothetical protein